MSVFNNRSAERVDAGPLGGEGFYIRERFADGVENLGSAVKLFARITVEPGTRMAYHQHVGDFEFYYILEGEGEYNDNGTPVPAKPGDVFKCNDGEWHAIRNTGDTNLVFVALIVATL